MKRSIAAEKAFKFSVRVYKLHKYLIQEHREYVIARQILRSGTSIGANIEEALGAQSEKEFISKLSTSYKEARETSYWLRLLKEVDLIAADHFESIHKDCLELITILSSILLSSKKKMANEPKIKK